MVYACALFAPFDVELRELKSLSPIKGGLQQKWEAHLVGQSMCFSGEAQGPGRS